MRWRITGSNVARARSEVKTGQRGMEMGEACHSMQADHGACPKRRPWCNKIPKGPLSNKPNPS